MDKLQKYLECFITEDLKPEAVKILKNLCVCDPQFVAIVEEVDTGEFRDCIETEFEHTEKYLGNVVRNVSPQRQPYLDLVPTQQELDEHEFMTNPEELFAAILGSQVSCNEQPHTENTARSHEQRKSGEPKKQKFTNLQQIKKDIIVLLDDPYVGQETILKVRDLMQSSASPQQNE